MNKVRGAYVGSSGTPVLCIGCVVPMWGVAVGLSYVWGAWSLSGGYGRAVLCIGYVVPMCVVR